MSKPESTGTDSMTYKVMLVDDEVDFTGALALRLRERGFAVDVANSGEEALEILDPNHSTTNDEREHQEASE